MIRISHTSLSQATGLARLVLGQGLHSNAVLQKIRLLCAMVREGQVLIVSISVTNNGLRTSEDQTLAITRHGPLDNEDLCPQEVFSDPSSHALDQTKHQICTCIIRNHLLPVTGALPHSWRTHHPANFFGMAGFQSFLLLTYHSLQRWSRGPCQYPPARGSVRKGFFYW